MTAADPDVIEPGAAVGVLGGGQLGAFFVRAAQRLGYRTTVWDPDPAAPALRLADRAVARPFDDAAAFAAFLEGVAAVTYEWENVPLALAQAIEARVPLRPSSRILGIIQNRLTQKRFLQSHGIPVAPFHAADGPGALPDAAAAVGFPCLAKTATSGYDGKGQWRLSDRAAAEAARAELERAPGGRRPLIVEQLMPFRAELSVLVARSSTGEMRLYPAAANVHEGGILITSRVPADLPEDVARRAAELARFVAERLELVGVCCVEMFVMPDDGLAVNEVAPRPHNSGHYTLDACTVSQFEQQARALCGLPLGDAELLASAVMVNLIGDAFTEALQPDGVRAIMETPRAVLHVYGKRAVRPGRKMGHITILRGRADEAWDAASLLRRRLQDAAAAAARA